MKKTSNPFEELLVGLVRANVEFITVGGIACAFNGYVRATEDVDLPIKSEPQNIRRLLQFLSGYGEGHAGQLQESEFTEEEGAIRVIEDFPIDIFTIIAGHRYGDFEKSTQLIEIQDCKIPFLSKEGLIELKRNSPREKDKMDVLNLSNIP